MSRMKVIGLLTAAAMAVPVVGLTGDWGEDLAKKAIGRVAREGIEEALKDQALDATLDAATRGAVRYTESELRERYEHEDIAAAVSTGVEVAMRASDVADTLDDVADVADTLKKVNKIRKVIR
jgi:hypothetical protein